MNRTALHRLVDQLPDEQIDQVGALVDAYRRADRAMIQALTAPEDSIEEFEISALAEAANDDPRETVGAEELKTELGL